METAQPAGGAGGKFEDRLPVVTRVRKCGGIDGDPYERNHSDKFTKKVVDPQQQALLEAVRRPREGHADTFWRRRSPQPPFQ